MLNENPPKFPDIGKNLKKLLFEKGVSSSALARAIGLSRVSISYIINGKIKEPKHQTLCAIAAFLDVPVERITEGVPESCCEPTTKPDYTGGVSIPVLSGIELFSTPTYERSVRAKEFIALPIDETFRNPVAFVAENSCLFPQYQRGDIFVINRILTIRESSDYYAGDDRDQPKEGALIAVKAEVKGGGVTAVGYACYGLTGELLVKVSGPNNSENRYVECRDYIGPVVAMFRKIA